MARPGSDAQRVVDLGLDPGPGLTPTAELPLPSHATSRSLLRPGVHGSSGLCALNSHALSTLSFYILIIGVTSLDKNLSL